MEFIVAKETKEKREKEYIFTVLSFCKDGLIIELSHVDVPHDLYSKLLSNFGSENIHRMNARLLYMLNHVKVPKRVLNVCMLLLNWKYRSSLIFHEYNNYLKSEKRKIIERTMLFCARTNFSIYVLLKSSI